MQPGTHYVPPRFALRARNIKNDPKVHDDPGDGVVKQYKEQAEKLHAEYKDKIAKMEAEHADEVLLLREELKAIQVRVEELRVCGHGGFSFPGGGLIG